MFFVHLIPNFLYLYPSIIDKIGSGKHNQQTKVVEVKKKPPTFSGLSFIVPHQASDPKKLKIVKKIKNT